MSHAQSAHTRGSVIHWARAYDLLTRLVGAGSSRKKVVDRAGLQAGEKVLDVGCGPGVLTLLAAERVGVTGEAHGIDPSPEMVKLATEKAAGAGASSGAKASFREGVMESLPYPDATFDAVLSSLMLHHLPEDVRTAGFREVARVLKPAGRLVAFDLTGKGWMWRILSLVGHRLPAAYGDQLAEQMKDAGLSPEVVRTGEKQFVTIIARKET